MPTGEFYVGSSSSIERRWWEHRNNLNHNAHHCAALQAAWNKHGDAAFVFEALEDVPRERLAQVEDVYLAQAVTTPLCFNTALTAMNPPSLDPAVAARIAATLKARFRDPTQHPRFGAKLSAESRAKISANRKGKAAGEAHYRYGKTVSVEVRKKIGDTQRGRPKAPRGITPEGRAKIMAAAAAGHYSHWKGRQHTAEAKAKMSRRVLVIRPDATTQEYPSLRAVLVALGLHMPTLQRALFYERPITKGPWAGYQFKYLT
jgi:group I intron endonuclease